MHTNTSWSIDDSRNKFQFGCEMVSSSKMVNARIVKNPNYRGIRPHLACAQRCGESQYI